MERNNIFGNWYITILTDDERIESGKPAWVGVNYQAEALETEDDVSPDWGLGSDGNTVKETAIECINMVWASPNGGLYKAVELASAMTALGIIPSNCLIDNRAALISGRWFFGKADENKHGIMAWNEFMEYHDPKEYGFSEEGQKLAAKIISSAVEEYEEFERKYDAWESTWIDGPQW